MTQPFGVRLFRSGFISLGMTIVLLQLAAELAATTLYSMNPYQHHLTATPETTE